MNNLTPKMDSLQITFRDFPTSEALEDRVRHRAAKLYDLFPKITMCRVSLEAPNLRHQKGHRFLCRVDLVVPNAELIARNAEQSDVSENAYAAVDEAFDEVARQLDEYSRRSRWDVKQHDGTPHARVAKLMYGEGPGTRFGFLETHDGREIYFHENSVLNRNFDKLEIGTEVRFAEEDGDKGPQASTVAMTKRRSTVTTTTANADEIPESHA